MTRADKQTLAAGYCDEYKVCASCPCTGVAHTKHNNNCAFEDFSEGDLDEYIDIFHEAVIERATEAGPDNVNHPKHYELPGGIECFDVILATQGEAAAQAFCVCNALKYLFRHKNKNGIEDVKKAKWYIDKYLELEAEP